MKSNQVTEETIKMLVDSFYLKVKSDQALGPIFKAVIGDDDAWGPHLQVMYDFWSSIMLRSGKYRGNPHQKHRELPSFDPKLFDRWLELFAQTAHEIHEPSIAEDYIERSNRIAESLKLSVQVGRL